MEYRTNSDNRAGYSGKASSPSGDDLVTTIKDWYTDCKEDNSKWRNKQDKWQRMRMRIKKQKTKPFVGCSNIRMPIIDTKIRKLKAALMNGVFGVRPIVSVLPSPGGSRETAIKIEKFIDHLVMNVIGIKKKAIIAIDQSLEKGFYLLKPYWNIKIKKRTVNLDVKELDEQDIQTLYDPNTPREVIDRFFAMRLDPDTSRLVIADNAEELTKGIDKILAGEEIVEFKFRDVIKNNPDVALVDPERLYVPSTSKVDPQDCQYIIHEFFMPLRDIESNVDNKDWSREAFDTIELSKDSDYNKTDMTKDKREGIQRFKEKGLIKIWEVYCYYDINGDGKEEKCVITLSPDFDAILRRIELPFYSSKFPFVKLFYELIDDRWFSHRSLAELIEDIVKEIDTQHMQRIDSQTMRNTPMFLYRPGQLKGKSKQFSFGRGIPVSGMQQLKDVIAPFRATDTNAEYSYKDEQQILEGKIAELIGVVDFNLQSQINKRQPRTEGEVKMHVQENRDSFSLDADMYREQFSELFNWIWDLWCQYGDDEYEFIYFGENGQESIKLSKEEIQNKYTINVRANDQNTNPQQKQQKAALVLQDAYQALQLGVAGPENVIAARKQALQELGVENWEEFVAFQPSPQKPPVQPITIQLEDLTPGERAQVLKSLGINPDVQGQMLAKKQELEQQQMDNNIELLKQMK